MAVFNEPNKWAQTLGKDADVTAIPDTASDTDPSIDKIFPSVFSIPLAQGGRAIPRSVLNGLFKLLGDWCYYAQNGGIASYSASFDYAVGSFVKYNDEFYRCIQANGISTTVKAPTETAYWSKITTLADVANAFANQDFSNVNNTANILMAHNAMPSNVCDDLTIGASGTVYKAPADGYIWVRATSTAVNQTIIVYCDFFSYVIPSVFINQVMTILIPIKKGDFFTFTYTVTPSFLRFIYAVGSESEQ